FNSLSGGDLMSEIMSAVTDRSDIAKPSEETNDGLKKQNKSKRNVSFTKQPAKSGANNKPKVAPLPSESEDNSSDNEEVSEEENQYKGIVPVQLTKPYGSGRSKSQGRQTKGKKNEEDIESENVIHKVQPTKNRSLGSQNDFKGSPQFNKKLGVQRDNYQFDLPNIDINLDLNFDSLSFNTIAEIK
ncbi:3164_t:CDS:2, partial [Scutellospora calospora]